MIKMHFRIDSFLLRAKWANPPGLMRESFRQKKLPQNHVCPAKPVFNLGICFCTGHLAGDDENWQSSRGSTFDTFSNQLSFRNRWMRMSSSGTRNGTIKRLEQDREDLTLWITLVSCLSYQKPWSLKTLEKSHTYSLIVFQKVSGKVVKTFYVLQNSKPALLLVLSIFWNSLKNIQTCCHPILLSTRDAIRSSIL